MTSSTIDLNSIQKLTMSGIKHVIVVLVYVGLEKSNIENDDYGIRKDIIEIECVGELFKRCVLFSCESFDLTLNHGT